MDGPLIRIRGSFPSSISYRKLYESTTLVQLCRFASAAVFGQAKPARPEFEVASIKPSPPQVPNQAAVGVHIDGAQFRCSYLALKDYLGVAYRVKTNQITGPDWVSTEQFDIAAKIPAGVKSGPDSRDAPGAARRSLPVEGAPRDQGVPGLRLWSPPRAA